MSGNKSLPEVPIGNRALRISALLVCLGTALFLCTRRDPAVSHGYLEIHSSQAVLVRTDGNAGGDRQIYFSSQRDPQMAQGRPTTGKKPGMPADLPDYHAEVQYLRQKLQKRLHRFQIDLRAHPKPILVGGVGNSGTRGVWSVLTKLGVYMGFSRFHEVRADTKDSKLFMKAYPLQWLNQTSYNLSAAKFYFSGLKSRQFQSAFTSTPSHLYNETTVRQRATVTRSWMSRNRTIEGELVWLQGMYFTLTMLETALHSSIEHVQSERRTRRIYHALDQVHWGFKHPRTVLMLPYLHQVLGGYFKFIHVVRDGREISIATNRKFYSTVCEKFYFHSVGPDSMNRTECDGSKRSRMEFWANMNREVSRFAETSFMSPSQKKVASDADTRPDYYLLRIEDIVVDEPVCAANLVRFIFENDTALVKKLVDVEAPFRDSWAHNMSYLGRKYSNRTKAFLSRKASELPTMREAMAYYGYRPSDYFGVNKPCTLLPV